jgi:hypothetical protein
VIEEIEELKRNEQTYLELRRQSLKRSRSRSRSPGKVRLTGASLVALQRQCLELRQGHPSHIFR